DFLPDLVWRRSGKHWDGRRLKASPQTRGHLRDLGSAAQKVSPPYFQLMGLHHLGGSHSAGLRHGEHRRPPARRRLRGGCIRHPPPRCPTEVPLVLRRVLHRLCSWHSGLWARRWPWRHPASVLLSCWPVRPDRCFDLSNSADLPVPRGYWKAAYLRQHLRGLRWRPHVRSENWKAIARGGSDY